MPKMLETYSTLRQLRDGLNEGKGMSAQEVADLLVEKINEMGIREAAKTYAWILRIEERGTRDRYIIRGLAQIYNRTEEQIAEIAAEPLKRNNK